MKVVSLAVTLIIGSSIAAPAAYATSDADKISLCMALSSLAETTMSARQGGVPMSAMISRMNEKGFLDGPIGKLNLTMIKMAYEVPSFSTSEYRAEAKREFGNQWMTTCMGTDFAE